MEEKQKKERGEAVTLLPEKKSLNGFHELKSLFKFHNQFHNQYLIFSTFEKDITLVIQLSVRMSCCGFPIKEEVTFSYYRGKGFYT